MVILSITSPFRWSLVSSYGSWHTPPAIAKRGGRWWTGSSLYGTPHNHRRGPVFEFSRTSVYKLIERGDLAVVRLLPDAPRIHRQDLDAMIAAHTGAEEAPGEA